MNPEVLVRDHIAQGRLVALSPRPLDTPLSFQWTRRLAGPLSPLRAAVRQAGARVLLAP
jgi:LysR family transcriptional regulator (chromosome initiation inhibitor)